MAERELHAIATIEREYAVMDARTASGETTEVVAFDASPGIAEVARPTMRAALDAADAAPGTLHVSKTLGDAGPDAGWYRV